MTAMGSRRWALRTRAGRDPRGSRGRLTGGPFLSTAAGFWGFFLVSLLGVPVGWMDGWMDGWWGSGGGRDGLGWTGLDWRGL
jgi:hypothetical protein